MKYDTNPRGDSTSVSGDTDKKVRKLVRKMRIERKMVSLLKDENIKIYEEK